MFSLIISIIAIALVAVLGSMSLFYGGQAFQKAPIKYFVDTLMEQGVQMQSAISYRNYPKKNETISNDSVTLHVLETNYYEGGKWSEANEYGMSSLNTPISEDACIMMNKAAGITERPTSLPSTGVFGCHSDLNIDSTEDSGGIAYYKIGKIN